LLCAVNWKSYQLASKLTMTCLALGTLWALSPIRAVAVWAVRIVAWTFLGPWMKLVDALWVHSWYETSEELLAKIAAAKGVMYNNTAVDGTRGVVVGDENKIAATALLTEPNLPDFKPLLDHDYIQH
jgi:hypothetical protein